MRYQKTTSFSRRSVTVPGPATHTNHGTVPRSNRSSLHARYHGGGEMRANIAVHQSAPRELTVKIRHRNAVIELKLLEQPDGEHQDCGTYRHLVRRTIGDHPELERGSRPIASLIVTTSQEVDTNSVTEARCVCGAPAVMRQAPASSGLDLTTNRSDLRALLRDRQQSPARSTDTCMRLDRH